jgi:hypothetical protein
MSLVRISLVLLLWLAGAAPAAVEFQRQTIAMEAVQGWLWICQLADVNDDGLTDLLVLLPAQNQMLVYRQRKSGFAAAPDQTVALPSQTAWVALRDVDAQAAGKELVISTATGLVYLRRDKGTFEPSPRPLLEVGQVFAGDHLRIVPTAPGGQDADNSLPVLFEDRAALYEKDADGTWHAVRTVKLSPKETIWQAREERWMTGQAPAFNLEVREMVRAQSRNDRAQESAAERKATQELIAKIVKDAQWRHYGVQYQDVNGDGREDLVLWTVHGDLNPAVTILLLLRGPDGHLPTRPTLVLRHNGVPVGVDRKLRDSPFWDLDGDGRCELILAALKTRITSWSGLVNLAVSGGVDWVLTIRSGRDGTYTGSPDFQMEITSMTPRSASFASLICFNGDFNGDGRRDILVERGPEQYDVYLSSVGTGYFQAGPALSFAAPIEVNILNTADLNGDRISDLFVQDLKEAQIVVCLSRSDQQKGPLK